MFDCHVAIQQLDKCGIHCVKYTSHHTYVARTWTLLGRLLIFTVAFAKLASYLAGFLKEEIIGKKIGK